MQHLSSIVEMIPRVVVSVRVRLLPFRLNVEEMGIAFPVPGNDDAARAVRLYCDAFGEAARKDGSNDPGVGEMENPPAEAAEATA